MTITEFAESRGKKVQTVSKYINRHPELFNKLIKRKGKEAILSDEALLLLSKLYPDPTKIEIQPGVSLETYQELKKENEELMKRMILLLEKQNEMADMKYQLQDSLSKQQESLQQIADLNQQIEAFEKTPFFKKMTFKFK